uniref:Exonuclease domain-containing protein n=2 Tax=Clastoptera arizonana TaxID=38151 RepID=A0A1B6BWP8_9HEMI
MSSMEQKSRTYHSDEESKSIPEAVKKEILKLNLQINSFNTNDLVTQLQKCHLSTDGKPDILRKRLKNHYRNKKLATHNILSIRKLFPYYVIMDFEATCTENNPYDYPHEIIEFPAVLVNTEKMMISDHFQSYVKPVINSKLSEFCIKLTGITQEMVDNAGEFPDVLEQFEAWLKHHKLGTRNKYVVVTDGPWDMRRFLFGQCKISGIPFPHFGKKWVNIAKLFSSSYKCKRMRLQLMLERLGLEFEGRPHCGLDDATNIARVLLQMINDGISIEPNEEIHNNPHWHAKIKIPNNKSINKISNDNFQDIESKNKEVPIMDQHTKNNIATLSLP